MEREMEVRKTFSAMTFDESGAVALDWVVIGTALAGLALSVLAVLSNGAETDPAIATSTVEIARDAEER
jgi:hypothetical protein